MPNMLINARIGLTPATSNCSIRKATQPWKTLAVPTKSWISFNRSILESPGEIGGFPYENKVCCIQRRSAAGFLFLVSSSLSQQFHTYVVKDLSLLIFHPVTQSDRHPSRLVKR
jgi:hypothetical protein